MKHITYPLAVHLPQHRPVGRGGRGLRRGEPEELLRRHLLRARRGCHARGYRLRSRPGPPGPGPLARARFPLGSLLLFNPLPFILRSYTFEPWLDIIKIPIDFFGGNEYDNIILIGMIALKLKIDGLLFHLFIGLCNLILYVASFSSLHYSSFFLICPWPPRP